MLVFGRWLVAVLLMAGAVFVPSPALAQDEEKAPAAKTKAAEEGATAEYNRLLEEWKGILKELRRLRTEYNNAKGGDTKPLEEQWNEQITAGNDLLPKLRTAAMQAYNEGRTADPQIQRFLLKLAQDAVDTDDYEVAFELAKSMLDRAEADKAPAPKNLYAIAGTSAFMTNQFEAAEKYFGLAKDAGVLSGPALEMSGKVSKYKDLWEKEQEIRQEEADDELPRVKISTTAGDMVIELFENEAPETVGNFVSLVESKFYDNTEFHRVLKGFMAQGGDPQGTGRGGPGYTIYDEVDKPNYRRHFRGTLSMAKQEAPDTGGSQFFICFGPTEHLDGKHTAFGRVIEGLDVLARIQKVNPEEGKPVERTKITSMEVLRKRDHKYLPHKVE